MDKNKKDFPVSVKINGYEIIIHLSLNDIISLTWGLSADMYIKLVTETLKSYDHLVHKEIAKKMNLG